MSFSQTGGVHSDVSSSNSRPNRFYREAAMTPPGRPRFVVEWAREDTVQRGEPPPTAQAVPDGRRRNPRVESQAQAPGRDHPHGACVTVHSDHRGLALSFGALRPQTEPGPALPVRGAAPPDGLRRRRGPGVRARHPPRGPQPPDGRGVHPAQGLRRAVPGRADGPVPAQSSIRLIARAVSGSEASPSGLSRRPRLS